MQRAARRRRRAPEGSRVRPGSDARRSRPRRGPRRWPKARARLGRGVGRHDTDAGGHLPDRLPAGGDEHRRDSRRSAGARNASSGASGRPDTSRERQAADPQREVEDGGVDRRRRAAGRSPPPTRRAPAGATRPVPGRRRRWRRGDRRPAPAGAGSRGRPGPGSRAPGSSRSDALDASRSRRPVRRAARRAARAARPARVHERRVVAAVVNSGRSRPPGVTRGASALERRARPVACARLRRSSSEAKPKSASGPIGSSRSWIGRSSGAAVRRPARNRSRSCGSDRRYRS